MPQGINPISSSRIIYTPEPDVAPTANPAQAPPALVGHRSVVLIEGLQVNKTGELGLFRAGAAEVSVRAAVWDDSGRPPSNFPPAGAEEAATVIRAKKGEPVQFGGGIFIYSDENVTGNLHYAIVVTEVDAKSRAASETLSQVGDVLQAAATFASPLTGVVGPATALLPPTASSIHLMAKVLKANDDDTLATFSGTLQMPPGGGALSLNLDGPAAHKVRKRGKQKGQPPPPTVSIKLSYQP